MDLILWPAAVVVVLVVVPSIVASCVAIAVYRGRIARDRPVCYYPAPTIDGHPGTGPMPAVQPPVDGYGWHGSGALRLSEARLAGRSSRPTSEERFADGPTERIERPLRAVEPGEIRAMRARMHAHTRT